MIALNIWGCWHANRGTHTKEGEEFSSCLGPAQTQKCARGRGASEKVPDWVELNHFSTWLREQEFWQETESERTQRPGGDGVCVWSRGEASKFTHAALLLERSGDRSLERSGETKFEG